MNFGKVFPALAAVSAMLLPAQARAEQEVRYSNDRGWAFIRLENGCVLIYYNIYLSVGEKLGRFTWTGGCGADGLISGPGVLSRHYVDNGFAREEHIRGARAESGLMQGPATVTYGGPEGSAFNFVNGCWNYPLDDGSWSSVGIMGCSGQEGATWRDRIRQAGIAAVFPNATSRQDDVPGHDDDAQVQARSRATQNTATAAADQAHVEADNASNCLETVFNPNNTARLVNRCDYTVEAAWCVEGFDCNPTYTNMWTIRGGGDYPVYAGRLREQGAYTVMFAACRGANTLTVARDDPRPFRHRCRGA